MEYLYIYRLNLEYEMLSVWYVRNTLGYVKVVHLITGTSKTDMGTDKRSQKVE